MMKIRQKRQVKRRKDKASEEGCGIFAVTKRQHWQFGYISDLHSPEGHVVAVYVQLVDPAAEYGVGDIELQGMHMFDVIPDVEPYVPARQAVQLPGD